MAEVWTTPTLDDVSTGELVTAAQLNVFGNDLRFLRRVAHVEFTANVTSTVTTEATAVTIVSAGAITFEAVPHLISFFAPRITAVAANTMRIGLFDGSTVVTGRAGAIFGLGDMPVFISCPITPTAVSHTYNFRMWNASASTQTVFAGTGGADGYGSGYISIFRVPT